MSKMTRYAEAKSVKVDNWGVFFLQKLQNFFNKTDHCDLTLQFNDNSQLKVHRLVLSACTDYFNHLENVCEMYDDVLIMPMDLQADVIVPIVNFMYTGTLEFQYNMYDRLLKTATDMNMTVLLKLLEAHRQTSRIAKQPVLLNKQAPRPAGRPVPVNMFPSAAQRHAQANRGRPRQQMVRRDGIVTHPTNKGINVTDPSAVLSKYSHTKDQKPGPSRFDDADLAEGFEGSFDTISYESKPLLTADQVKKEEEASPFEKLRKGYTNVNVVKRAASSGSVTSPPAKKPNLDEVKEFTEAARLRSQLTTDDDDSPDYVDDDTHFNDDDDEDYQPPASVKAAVAKVANQQGGKQIVIKQEAKSPGSGSTMKQITVNDNTGNVDHAKIISEVLKKYPHLVKKNKNIKLKIMQKGVPAASTSITGSNTSTTTNTSKSAQQPKMEVRTATPLKQDLSMVRKATANIRSEQTKPPVAAGGSSVAAKPTTSSAPKTIDAKTMHALIAKGAENMTGPWLCLRCGINGRPISIPSYKAFRNHLVVKHKERIDPRICEHCGWKAEQRNPNLLYHWYTEHNIKPTISFPTCDECGHVAMNAADLQKHEDEQHARGELQQCIYCNKVFAKEMELYDHMKEHHKQRAIADGVLDFTDDEYHEEEEEEELAGFSPTAAKSPASRDGKIKILSNITLPSTKGSALTFVAGGGGTKGESAPVQQITLEPSSEAEALSNVASGIATSLGLVGENGVVLDDANYQNQFIEAELASVHGENATVLPGSGTVGGENIITKLVTEDGTELQLTQSQKDEIISQLQNPTGNNVVMVLNEDNFAGGSTLQIGEGVQIVNTASTDSQNLMLMYGQEEGALENSDSQKSETKADVTASEEDENSQASVALSEDRSATADGKRSHDGDAPMEEGEESQDSRKTDVTDKELQHGEQEDDDVDMSADVTSETHESALQQAAKEAGIEEDDSKSADEKDLDQSEERQKSDKLKLISELEGDWSEDTAEEQAAAPAPPTKPVEETEKPAKPTEGEKKSAAAASPAVAKANVAKKSTELANKKKDSPTAEGKDFEKLLDDWNSEAKLDESDAEEGDLEKKMEKVTGLAPADSTQDSIGSLNETVVKKEKNEEQKEKDDVASKDKVDAKEATADKKLESEKATKSVESESAAVKGKKNGTTASNAPAKIDTSKPEDEAGEGGHEDDEDDDDDEKDKTASKSKEVSSLLGEWDEDDDL